MADQVVITGLGVFSPIGQTEEAFWESLRLGKSAAGPVDAFDTSELPRHIACQITRPIPVDRPMGRAAALAVASAKQAVADAGIDPVDIPRGRLAIIVGTTMGETQFIEERLDGESADWLSTEHVKRIAAGRPGTISANIQAALSVAGCAVDLYGACAAGNLALATARRRLLSGECDVALAGGADGFSRLAFVGFMRARVMSKGRCCPFDANRDGLLVGEGGVMFVLERESSARARGARVRARLLAGSMTCEDYHPTRPHPEGDGLTRAIQIALGDAGLREGDIDYVCAHGTGTPQNDAVEVKVMQKCFPGGVAFSSIKGLTGHTMGAAAALETACCILCMEHQLIIPTWNLDELLAPCDLDAVRGSPRAGRLNYVINNSAGFGGYNSTVVLAPA